MSLASKGHAWVSECEKRAFEIKLHKNLPLRPCRQARMKNVLSKIASMHCTPSTESEEVPHHMHRAYG